MYLRKFYFLIFFLALTTAAFSKIVKLPYFDENLISYIELIKNSNFIDINRTSNQTIISNTSTTPSNAFAGITLQAERLTWRQYYHWWNIHITLSGKTRCGSFDISIKCFNEDDVLIDEITLVSLSQPNFATSINKTSIPVPKCFYNDTDNNVTYFQIGFDFNDWEGEIQVDKIIIEKYNLTATDRDPYLLKNNKAEIGALMWFDPSYEKAGTVSQAMRDTAHKLFAVAGINKMRMFAIWGEHFRKKDVFRVDPTFEIEKGKYDFQKLDDYVKELAYYGNSIGVLTLWGTPEWSHSKTKKDIPDYKLKSTRAYQAIENATFPPDNWDDYQNFVKAMVNRYDGKIEGYEVWNEPDVWQYGLTYGYQGYSNYLKKFYSAAKQVNPDTKVYLGRVGIWLSPLIRQYDIQNFCDAIASHPYPGRMAAAPYSTRRIDELVKVMNYYNIYKPIIVTEVGLGAGYPWPGPGGFHGEQAKAENSKLLIEELSRYTKEIYWYTPIQAGRAYGIIHYINDRYRPNPIYYTFADFNGKLNNEKAPVKAKVVLPDKPLKKSKKYTITLIAENSSDIAQKINFWPVGLIDDLGYNTFQSIRIHDQKLTLLPGEMHKKTISVIPNENAFGKYPIGLAVINENGNSLALKELPIWSIAATAEVSASSCDEGTVEAVNSLFEPVWSGDIDLPRLIWDEQKNYRTEWVQLNFDKKYDISHVSVYWVANPKPGLNFPELEYDSYVLPADWNVMYKQNENWLLIDNTSQYPIKANQYNKVQFKKIKTDAIRIQVKLKPEKKAGILQIKIQDQKEF